MKRGFFQFRPAWVVSFLVLACLAGCRSPESTTFAPTILFFSAYPDTIDKKQTTTLYWNIIDADTASIDNGIGAVPVDGNKAIAPTKTTTYVLTAASSAGTRTASATVTVVETAVLILDGTPEKKMTDNGHPYYDGYVKNIGSKTGYNCLVTFRAYSDTDKNNLIDTATGQPANLGNIDPDQRAHYEAVFINLNSWDQIKASDYSITWSIVTGRPDFESGITKGLIRP